MEVTLGIERLAERLPRSLSQARFGILMNQASVDAELNLVCDVIADVWPDKIAALFSPQHGIWGEQQANMIETGHATYPRLDVPIFSLYSQSRRPSAEMLDRIDCLIIDLQDVGTRVYTFIWTLLECLHACAAAGKPVIVCDRPNPVGGAIIEGPMLDADFKSFVGGLEIPLRHGLTIAELAQLFVKEQALDVELHCLEMRGWKRNMMWRETGRRWVWPSPNMPTDTTAYVYPGQVLLEGTNLSEGRGTTRPFEVVGAPFLDPDVWLKRLLEFEHPGLTLRPTRFEPVFDKWHQQSCGGIDLVVEQPESVRSVSTTLAIILTAHQLAPDAFQWLPPPYEYEFEKAPISILWGNNELAEFVSRNGREPLSQHDIGQLLALDEDDWRTRTDSVKLYA